MEFHYFTKKRAGVNSKKKKRFYKTQGISILLNSCMLTSFIWIKKKERGSLQKFGDSVFLKSEG